MPTFTAIVLENLIETSTHIRKPLSKPKTPLQTHNPQDRFAGKQFPGEKRSAHIYIPSLYTVPKQTPVGNSPPVLSISPSPYVVNHKRRDSRVVYEVAVIGEEESSVEVGLLDELEEVGMERREENGNLVIDVGEGDFSLRTVGVNGEGGEFGEFLDNQDSASVASGFFDAADEFSRDGSVDSSPSFASVGPVLSAELDSVRLELMNEVDKRKKTERTLEKLYAHWDMISKQLSQLGLSLPPSWDPRNPVSEVERTGHLFLELAGLRSSEETAGRKKALAEAEGTAEIVLASKNNEIARLRDRLQYYEEVNHQMMLRNLEIAEISRRRSRNRGRWLWGCVGLSITVGVGCLASYYPRISPKSSVNNQEFTLKSPT